MQVFYSDTFELPLPPGHRFPIEKYGLLRERLLQSDFRDHLDLRLPDSAKDEQLLLVHSRDYLDKLKHGTLSRVEERRIGFPWSPKMVERSRRSTGATIGAARAALQDGVGVHLAGGTHHAFAEHGQGFCVFNDIAVTVRVLQTEGLIRRAVIIDLDVHQGNGTAAVFADDSTVFTFSMHGASNFPFSKQDGDLDVALADGTTDVDYVTALGNALDNQLPLSNADVVFYLAGADPYEHDRYGKLKLTKSGLAKRDVLVFQACRLHEVPVAVVMAGGYAKSLADIAEINFETVRVMLGTSKAPRA